MRPILSSIFGGARDGGANAAVATHVSPYDDDGDTLFDGIELCRKENVPGTGDSETDCMVDKGSSSAGATGRSIVAIAAEAFGGLRAQMQRAVRCCVVKPCVALKASAYRCVSEATSSRAVLGCIVAALLVLAVTFIVGETIRWMVASTYPPSMHQQHRRPAPASEKGAKKGGGAQKKGSSAASAGSWVLDPNVTANGSIHVHYAYPNESSHLLEQGDTASSSDNLSTTLQESSLLTTKGAAVASKDQQNAIARLDDLYHNITGTP